MGSLRAALATPERKRQFVRRLFATIADRYDLITVLLSYGQDRRWKRRLVSMAGVQDGEMALDAACGTGDLAFELTARGARVVALDITARMIELARGKRSARGRPAFLIGDMTALPFPDRSFDLVTTGYGIRNLPVLDAGLREIHRVLKPGGRMLSLDFDRPEGWVARTAYLGYLTVVGSVLGQVLHGDSATYRYIPASIRRYPGAAGVARRMRELGFPDAGHVPLFGGLMAVNVGTRSR